MLFNGIWSNQVGYIIWGDVMLVQIQLFRQREYSITKIFKILIIAYPQLSFYLVLGYFFKVGNKSKSSDLFLLIIPTFYVYLIKF